MSRSPETARPATPVARLTRALHRPDDIVEATRWLFGGLALISLLIVLPAMLSQARGATLVAAVAASVYLATSWLAGFSWRRVTLAMDVGDALAIMVVALACPSPSTAFGFVFAAVWFRSLYGSTPRAVLRCALYAAALAACLPLWSMIPTHAATTDFAPVIGSFPTMFLTVIVGRHLAATIRARAEAAARDAVQVSLGAQLLGVTDAAEIRRVAWVAINAICAATPGLRVLHVVRNGTTLRVDGASAGFAHPPVSLPAVVPDEAGGVKGDWIPGQAEADIAVGATCVWVRLPLPSVPGRSDDNWLLVGSPRAASLETISSVTNLITQVTLALRNSQVHLELTVQATLDSLTNLANRPSFNTALASAFEERRGKMAVLFVDLDDFKDVNDVYGHAAGDELLQEVASRLLRTTRPDDLCARLGGDEFAVLLRDTTEAGAAEIAQRIVDSIAAPMHLSVGAARVGASVGVATAANDAGVEQLIHRADVAMYAAKANGKAQFRVFEAGLLRTDSSRVTFERDLAVAVQRDELVVHYQPIISLVSHRCIAVEALVRWNHPTHGLLYPGSFIDAAERSGAIVDIGAWVLRRACADLVVWQGAHPSAPLAVHVNVSSLQLDNDEFIDEVMQCLRDFALDPDRLVLEITETTVISSPAAIGRLESVAAHGVTIAIDDFGTGYSALTTLRSLPVGIVKIDKSFIAGSTVNSEDRAVTDAVVTMASHLGLQTIAEGVERLDQEMFLESIGADAVQGFLYQRPTSAEDFGAWLAAHLASVPRTNPATHIVVPFIPRQTA